MHKKAMYRLQIKYMTLNCLFTREAKNLKTIGLEQKVKINQYINIEINLDYMTR